MLLRGLSHHTSHGTRPRLQRIQRRTKSCMDIFDENLCITPPLSFNDQLHSCCRMVCTNTMDGVNGGPPIHI